MPPAPNEPMPMSERAANDILAELAKPLREKMAHDEITCDPIFLGQVKRCGPACHACQSAADEAPDATEFWEAHTPCDECFTYWDTETVFLSRAEGEAWMKAREYRWSGWRVYCVPAEGSMRGIVNGGDGSILAQALALARSSAERLKAERDEAVAEWKGILTDLDNAATRNAAWKERAEKAESQVKALSATLEEARSVLICFTENEQVVKTVATIDKALKGAPDA